MPTPEEHALLSASSSSRWLHCTRAPRLEETLPEKQSKDAEEGRLALEREKEAQKAAVSPAE